MYGRPNPNAPTYGGAGNAYSQPQQQSSMPGYNYGNPSATSTQQGYAPYSSTQPAYPAYPHAPSYYGQPAPAAVPTASSYYGQPPRSGGTAGYYGAAANAYPSVYPPVPSPNATYSYPAAPQAAPAPMQPPPYPSYNYPTSYASGPPLPRHQDYGGYNQYRYGAPAGGRRPSPPPPPARRRPRRGSRRRSTSRDRRRGSRDEDQPPPPPPRDKSKDQQVIITPATSSASTVSGESAIVSPSAAQPSIQQADVVATQEPIQKKMKWEERTLDGIQRYVKLSFLQDPWASLVSAEHQENFAEKDASTEKEQPSTGNHAKDNAEETDAGRVKEAVEEMNAVAPASLEETLSEADARLEGSSAAANDSLSAQDVAPQELLQPSPG